MKLCHVAVLFIPLFAPACHPERPEAYMESCAENPCPAGQGLVCVDYGVARGEPLLLCTLACSDKEDCPINKCPGLSCGDLHGIPADNCTGCGFEVPGYCGMDCEW